MVYDSSAGPSSVTQPSAGNICPHCGQTITGWNTIKKMPDMAPSLMEREELRTVPLSKKLLASVPPRNRHERRRAAALARQA